MKKTLLFFAAMCCIMVANAQNESATPINGIYFILDNTNKTATVTSGDYNDTYLKIPSEVTHDETTYTVTSIGNYAFNNCSSLKDVDITDNVTSIGNYAFNNCSSLEIVNIPNTVTSIGDQAFNNCSSLTTLVIPEGVNSIGNSAFQGCSGLTSMTIPKSVSSIGDFAFKSCSGLTSVSISEGVGNIGDYAFELCSKLTIIIIPSTVKSFGYQPFMHCANLTSVIVLATNPPALDGNYFGVWKDVLLHTPDAQAYKNLEWGGFSDIRNVENYKSDAIDYIYNAMQGERSSAYLNGLVQNNLNAIDNSDDYAVINKNRVEAIGKLKPVISIYKEIKTAELGSLGTPQTGCAAVRVTKGDDEVILYAPDKVRIIKIPANE